MAQDAKRTSVAPHSEEELKALWGKALFGAMDATPSIRTFVWAAVERLPEKPSTQPRKE